MNLAVARERLAESVYDNPVITREFRTRMRGWKAFATMGGYILLLAAVQLIAYYSLWSSYSSSGESFGNAKIGLQLFSTLIWTQTILLALIVPSLTSGAITTELEKKTLPMLALSKLTPGRIVFGKQFSAFLYAFMLVMSSLPLAGICLMLGGISPIEILIVYLLLMGWSFLLTSFGVIGSSMVKRSPTAALLAFGLSIIYTIFTSVWGAENISYGYRYGTVLGSRPVDPFNMLNPGWASQSALSNTIICGIRFPAVLVPIVLHIAIGTLFILIASTHVKYCRAEKALPIRLLFLGITAVLVWLITGDTYSGISPDLDVMSTLILIIAIFISAAIATGSVKLPTGKSIADYAFSPGKMFKSDIGGAISFTILWTVVAYGIYGLTKWWCNGVHMPSPAPSPVNADFWKSYFQISIPMIMITIATCAIGILASTIVTRRQNAAGIVIIFAITIFAFYGIALVNRHSTISSIGPFWHLAALWPITPILASTNGWNADMPYLSWIKNAWIVTSLAYLLITALALWLASKTVNKFPGVREESD